MVIYALYDVRTPGVVRYVGQTREGAEKRFGNHRAQARRGTKSYVYNWMRNVGIENVQYKILEELLDATALDDREIYWIEFYRFTGHPLTNVGSGGSAVWTGSKRPAQSLRMRGESNPMWGQDRRETMRLARSMRGPLTPETRAIWSEQRRGEGNSRARLKEDDVREIRRLFATGEYSKSAIARMYGITVQSIWALLTGKTWKHVV
jgi:hypothetical protein